MPFSIRILPLTVCGLLCLFVQCQQLPDSASPLFYVTANRADIARKAADGCAFRYSIVNAYERLDNTTQQTAIRNGFEIWQKTNPNLYFLNFGSTFGADLLVQFVDPAVLQNQQLQAPVGLLRGSVPVASTFRKDPTQPYTILLSSTFDWNKDKLTKAIAHHVGLYLGMNTSDDKQSLMYPLFVGKSVAAARADSVLINQLYSLPCKDLGVSYLPLALKINKEITQKIRIDQQGIIYIRATGSMIVGEFVGTSTPIGRTEGVLGFSLSTFGYNIVPEFNHAALMYKLNHETAWRLCGAGCEFRTDGNPYMDLTFGINDNNLSDNIGTYDVTVGYK